jgi:hypothetical protein
MTQKELLENVLSELGSIKKGLPNGELKHMMRTMDEFRDNQNSMKEDISELKKTLLDPNDGVIVATNKNTEFRRERLERLPYYENLIVEFQKLQDWKNGVTRALWIVFTVLAGIIIKFLSEMQG